MTFETFDQSNDETLPDQKNTYIPTYLPTYLTSSGGTLLRDNCQLIGMPLIVLARQAQKNRD